jgi:hypothetical protein
LSEDLDVAPRPDPVSEAALARHARRMRPLRIAYVAVLTVLAAVLASIVVVAYRHGEISHATLRTVAKPPAPVVLGTPSQPLTPAWTSGDTTAIGAPEFQGTVVTHDQHTVRGRNARTGAQTWSYTRTDRPVCAAIQTAGVTVAVYQLHGNCDELTALDTRTGARKWTRTLDKDGAGFDGRASYSVLSGEIMFVSATSIYALQTTGTADAGNGGLDYWVFHHPGCTINGGLLGLGGALISQTCVHEDCSDNKFCGDGRQLLLRDAIKGTEDDSKSTNPDQIVWNLIGSDLVPTSAGHVIAARDPAGGTLEVLDPKHGRPTARLPLAAPSTARTPAAFTSAGDADLVWVGGHTYAIRGTSVQWQTDTPNVPTVTAPAGAAPPDLAQARLAVATSAGIAELDGATGHPARTFSVAAPAAGSLVYPLGTGFLVAGPSTVCYR